MIVLAYNNVAQLADLVRNGGNIQTDAGLETAVLISYFTHRRADDDDDLPSPGDKRGWWGDAYPDEPGHKSGSRLWLLARSNLNQSTLNLAVQYAEESLQWMIADKVAISVQATAERIGQEIMGLGVEIERSRDPTSKWSRMWEVHLGDL